MIDALAARMTRREKIAQLCGVRYSDIASGGVLDAEKMRARLRHGIGFVTRIGVESGRPLDGVGRVVCEVQQFLHEQTRLGLPALVAEEALSGYCARGATQFPQAIGLASTWDPQLVSAVATTIGGEMRDRGAHVALAPLADVATDPRWGRLEETFGADPHLVSSMAVAYIHGIQRQGIGATAKHFVAHGASEGGVNCGPVSLAAAPLHDVHVAPFRAVIAAGVANVMTAYHALNDEPCTASPRLLRGLLREDLGFEGLVVSDFWAIDHLVSRHEIASDKVEAARVAFDAGVDVELPTQGCFPHLDPDDAALDAAVRRVLRQKLAPRDPYSPTPDAVELACRAATQSLVLLTNDGTLPLRPCRVAVVGPTADDPTVMLGDYSYAHQRADYAGEAPAVSVVTPLAALRSSFRRVDYAPGAPLVGNGDAKMLRQACAVARRADVALVFVGGRSGTGADATSGELRDVEDLRLPRGQRALLRAVTRVGTPTVAVVISGRAYAFGDDLAHVHAALHAWLPGEQGGAAIAAVLTGEASPSGRLPVALLRVTGDVGRAAAPLFPLGHGLTYTRFGHSAPRVSDREVSVNVANIGRRPGDDVVQLRYRHRHDRRLVAFRRVHLAPGAATTVRFAIGGLCSDDLEIAAPS